MCVFLKHFYFLYFEIRTVSKLDPIFWLSLWSAENIGTYYGGQPDFPLITNSHFFLLLWILLVLTLFIQRAFCFVLKNVVLEQIMCSACWVWLFKSLTGYTNLCYVQEIDCCMLSHLFLPSVCFCDLCLSAVDILLTFCHSGIFESCSS